MRLWGRRVRQALALPATLAIATALVAVPAAEAASVDDFAGGSSGGGGGGGGFGGR